MSKKRKNEEGKITLTANNVDPAVWHGFKETCKVKARDRGEVLSMLMEEWVWAAWRSKETPERLIGGYRKWMENEKLRKSQNTTTELKGEILNNTLDAK